MLDDHEVRGAAADIHAGHTNGPAIRGVLPVKAEDVVGIAAKLVADLVVEPDQMGGRGLVPVQLQRGARVDRIVVRPAIGLPDQCERVLDPPADDPLLGDRRRRRQGQDQRTQASRQVGMGALFPHGDRVDLAERVAQKLGDHQAVEGRARVERLQARRLAMGEIALLGQLRRHRAGDARNAARFGQAAARVGPRQRSLLLIPEVALGTRQARGPLRAVSGGGELRRFRPDADRARPPERVLPPPGSPAVVQASEACGRELDPACEGIGIDLFRPRQVAQLEPIGPADVDAHMPLRPLDQDAAGPYCRRR